MAGIEASLAGNKKALPLLRGYYDWFNTNPYLPELMRRSAQGVQGMVALASGGSALPFFSDRGGWRFTPIGPGSRAF